MSCYYKGIFCYYYNRWVAASQELVNMTSRVKFYVCCPFTFFIQYCDIILNSSFWSAIGSCLCALGCGVRFVVTSSQFFTFWSSHPFIQPVSVLSCTERFQGSVQSSGVSCWLNFRHSSMPATLVPSKNHSQEATRESWPWWNACSSSIEITPSSKNACHCF